jgi:rhodanese-related sulfurtransferase
VVLAVAPPEAVVVDEPPGATDAEVDAGVEVEGDVVDDGSGAPGADVTVVVVLALGRRVTAAVVGGAVAGTVVAAGTTVAERGWGAGRTRR